MSPWTPEPTERGRVVVALAPPPARREQWSADILLDLLDRWSDAGHRVVLADCVLEHPTLHRSVGLPNEEGVTDAALFGASVSRVARPVPGRTFFFVGAGSPTGAAETVLASPRWARLQDGFRDAGVTLVAFVRQGCAGEAALLGGADDVVVLSETPETVPGGAHDAADKVRAVLGPAVELPDPDGAPDQVETEVEHPDPVGATDPTHPLEAVGPAASVDPLEALAPGLHDQGPASEDEDSVMDFSEAPGAHPEGPDDEVGTAADSAGHEPGAQRAPDPHPIHARRATREADPDARKKLLWVALAVLILVVLVVLGALG